MIYAASQTAIELNNSKEKYPMRHTKDVKPFTDNEEYRTNILHPNKKNKDKIETRMEPEFIWQTNNYIKEEEGNKHLHQLTKTLFKITKEHTHPKHRNKKYQMILTQLWKEAIMSRYMINNHDEGMIQDLLINLLEILSESDSDTSDQTNPVPNEPDYPAANAKDTRETPSPIHSHHDPSNRKYDTSETTMKSPETSSNVGIRRDGYIKHSGSSTSAPSKDSNIGGQKDDYCKHLTLPTSAPLDGQKNKQFKHSVSSTSAPSKNSNLDGQKDEYVIHLESSTGALLDNSNSDRRKGDLFRHLASSISASLDKLHLTPNYNKNTETHSQTHPHPTTGRKTIQVSP